MFKIIRQLLNKVGFDVVRTRNQHTSLEEHIGRVLTKYAIDCVIDVGANSGQYGGFLRDSGFQGWIISFEPVNAPFRQLTRIADKDEKWICYNYALADKEGQQEINVYDSTVFSSFLEANDYSKNIWGSLNGASKELVEVVTLDQILADIEDKTACRLFYLKLDTQGFDRKVLQGAIKSLEKVKALQFELSLIHIYDEMIDPYEFLNEMRDRNFLISGMYPINRDESLAVIEYDCVLVRSAAGMPG